MAMLREHQEGGKFIIPVRIKKGGSIPLEIGERAYADLTTTKRWNKNFPKLCRAVHGRKQQQPTWSEEVDSNNGFACQSLRSRQTDGTVQLNVLYRQLPNPVQ
jgi:hypothetical protein